ncbi:MAG: response regulator [Lachnospiraceae bacterium]|nr:response regulator [Lachnospiraceae bacterium]
MKDVREQIKQNGMHVSAKRLLAVLLPGVALSLAVLLLIGYFGPEKLGIRDMLLPSLLGVFLAVLPSAVIFYLFMKNQQRREEKLFLVLSTEEERYRLAFESSRDVIFEYDYEMDVMQAFGTLEGRGEEETHGDIRLENFLDVAVGGGIFYHDDIQKVIDFKNGKITEPFDMRFRWKTTEPFRWIKVEGTIVYDHGKPAKLVGKFRDIEEEKRHERDLLENSKKDGVTDFYTWEVGNKVIDSRIADPNEKITLMFFKILNMKQIDDTYGAIFANAIIVHVAEVLKSCTRSGDMLIRLNRGSFVGILPEISEEGMLMMQTGMERSIEHMYTGAADIGGLDYIVRYFSTKEDLMKVVSQETSTESDNVVQSTQGARFDTVSFAFNILEHTQDLSSAMGMLLEYVGTQFNLLTIHINERLDAPGMEQCLYDWTSGPMQTGFHRGQRRRSEPAEVDLMYSLVYENDFLVCDSDVMVKFREETRRLMGANHTSHMLVAIISASQIIGVIDYEHLNPEYKWPEGTVATLVAVTRVISSYIMKHKSESASRAKSDFLSSMSHEIRTPMNAIVGFSELILTEPGLTGNARKYTSDIKNAADSLLAIVNDILDFSKIESGKFEIIPGEYRLSSLLHDICAIVQVRLSEREVAFRVEFEGEIPDGLYGDADRVKQVLLNLLTNATKFTNKGSIVLRLAWEKKGRDSGILHAAVKDTGIGIRKEDMGRLFESFSQVDTARNKSIKGTGLGLVITRNLLRLMGGDVGVESEYGVGSEFFFHVPQGITDDTPCSFDQENYSKPESEIFRVPFKAPSARVMIVDDNRVNLEVAKGLIGQYGVEVVLAGSGEEALERFHERQDYDIIFMDHMMPKMDGIETTTHIRHMEKKEGTMPVVALTANAIKGMDKMFLDAGMNDYLSKPINQKKLSEVMMRFIPEEKQEAVREEVNRGPAQEASGAGLSPAVFFKNEFEGLQGIDLSVGLSNCVGDKGVYRDLLGTFLKDRALDAIIQYYEAEDWDNYQISVHGLKSSANYIGAGELSAQAKKLEDLAKDKRIEEIREEHPKLLPLYREVAGSIAQVIGDEKKDEPAEPMEEIAPETLLAIVGDLLSKLENMEFSEAEQVAEVLNGMRAADPRINELIGQMRSALDAFDYDEAGEKAGKIKLLLL